MHLVLLQSPRIIAGDCSWAAMRAAHAVGQTLATGSGSAPAAGGLMRAQRQHVAFDSLPTDVALNHWSKPMAHRRTSRWGRRRRRLQIRAACCWRWRLRVASSRRCLRCLAGSGKCGLRWLSGGCCCTLRS